MLKRGPAHLAAAQARLARGARRAVVSVRLLKRGVYEIDDRVRRSVGPRFERDEDARPQHTGFQLKYAGPDTDDRLIALPHHRLFRVLPRTRRSADGIAGLPACRPTSSTSYYTSSLRDIRRTYQRAFKALLFAHRFRLSAERWADRRSELGYMLDAEGASSPGARFYRSGAGLRDSRRRFRLQPAAAAGRLSRADRGDGRARPADRCSAGRRCSTGGSGSSTTPGSARTSSANPIAGSGCCSTRPRRSSPPIPRYLLRHMGADARHWLLDLHYFQDQSAPVYSVTFDDLEDDRWVVRAWHADDWIRRLLQLLLRARTSARRGPISGPPTIPARWFPGPDPTGNPNPTGNANLSQFLVDGCIENNTPRRYEDLKRLNDCLRERGRDALLAYLCAMNRVPLPWGGFAQSPNDLSNLLAASTSKPACASGRAGSRKRSPPCRASSAAPVSAWSRRGRSATASPSSGIDASPASRSGKRASAASSTRRTGSTGTLTRQRRRSNRSASSQSELRRSTADRRRCRAASSTGRISDLPRIRACCCSRIAIRRPLTQLNPAREGLGLLGTPERDARPSWLAPLLAQARQQERRRHRSGIPAGAPTPVRAASGQLPFWIECGDPARRAVLSDRRRRRAAGVGHFEPHGRPCEAGMLRRMRMRPSARRSTSTTSGCSTRGSSRRSISTDSPSFTNFEQDDYYDPTTQDVDASGTTRRSCPPCSSGRSSPMVRLAWCRVHNGEFKQPRRSYAGVQVIRAAPRPT